MTLLVRRIGLALGCGALAAAGVLWLTRRPGPGLSPDSMSYLGAARTIARGASPRVPFADWSDADSTTRLRDYPPLFPAAIAAGMALGAPGRQAARGVLSVAAAGSAGGIALLVASSATGVTGVLAAIAVAIAPAFVEDHYIVLSEPLFLACLVLAAGLMNAGRPKPLALGLAAGAAAMVRYAGVSLPLACALWCLGRHGPWRERASGAALAGGPGVAAFLLWSHWASGLREYGWKGHLGPTLAEGWGTIEAWLVPAVHQSGWRSALSLAALAAAALVLALGVRAAAPASRRLLAACGLLAGCYVGIVFFSRLFADKAIPFDNRICSPLLLLVTVSVVTAGNAAWRAWPASVRGAAGLLVLLWMTGSAWVVAHEARELADDGWGYASADWVNSPLGRWLRTDGRRYALYSDNAPSLFAMAGRPSRWLPDVADSGTVRALGAVLDAHPSALVGFAYPDTEANPGAAVFAAPLGYREVARSDEGAVWVK